MNKLGCAGNEDEIRVQVIWGRSRDHGKRSRCCVQGKYILTWRSLKRLVEFYPWKDLVTLQDIFLCNSSRISSVAMATIKTYSNSGFSNEIWVMSYSSLIFCCVKLEVIFISSQFAFLFGPLNLSLKFEYDLISCCWDILLLMFSVSFPLGNVFIPSIFKFGLLLLNYV